MFALVLLFGMCFVGASASLTVPTVPQHKRSIDTYMETHGKTLMDTYARA